MHIGLEYNVPYWAKSRSSASQNEFNFASQESIKKNKYSTHVYGAHTEDV
jgi:hypothetical protein